MQLILDKTGAKNIHLIAHSMGNRPLVDVLGEMANNHTGPKRINEIILAAPDIDAGEFKTVAKSIGDIAHGVTLYASSNDRAMLASRTAHGEALRAGDVSASGPVIIKGIQSLDVSALNTDILALNHSTYAELQGAAGRHLEADADRRAPSKRAHTAIAGKRHGQRSVLALRGVSAHKRAVSRAAAPMTCSR